MIALLLVALATPAEERMADSDRVNPIEALAGQGITVDPDTVWEQIRVRCRGDNDCFDRNWRGYQRFVADFGRSKPKRQAKIVDALKADTDANGVSWYWASVSFFGEEDVRRADRAYWNAHPTFSAYCSTYVSKSGRHVSSSCSSW